MKWSWIALGLVLICPPPVFASVLDEGEEDALQEILHDEVLDSEISDDEAEIAAALEKIFLEGFAQSPDPEASLRDFLAEPVQVRSEPSLETRYPFLVLENRKGEERVASSVGFDIPMAVHPLVDVYVDYFTGRGRKFFTKWLNRLARYQPIMEPILVEAGLPKDIIYLAMIESGLSSRATSWAQAAGFWQFIRSTGRMYKLRVDFWADERRDFIKATHSAAWYLKDLYRQFGDWHLAWAAYNAGGGRVSRALRKYNADNFWALADNSKSLAKETRHYVPKILAAAIVAKDAEALGFKVEPLSPLEFTELEVTDAVDLRLLGRKFGISLDTLKTLNPAFPHQITPPKYRTIIRVPTNLKEEVASWLESVPPSKRLNFAKYQVRRGDTLSHIARRFGTTVSVIRQFNSGINPRYLRLGSRLIVPILNGNKQHAVASRSSAPHRKKARAKRASSTGATHRVRAGDTLWSIARRYQTTVTALRRANSLRNNKIQIGRLLKVR